MVDHKLRMLHTALFFVAFLSGAPAFAQKQVLQGLPNVNLGLSVPKLGVDATVGLPRLDVPTLPKAVLGDPSKLLPTVSVGVPGVGLLTPPVRVKIDTSAPGSALDVGVSVRGSASNSPPVPETAVSPQQVQHLAEKRVDLLPTCR